MRHGLLAAAFLASAWLNPSITAGQDAPKAAGDELRAHLETLGRRLDDPSNDLATRERIAVEMATTLDRAALSAVEPEVRWARWTEAAEVLDGFTRKNPGHPDSWAFQVQSAVYLWARGRDRMRTAGLNPLDAAGRRAAAADMKSCVERLRAISRAFQHNDDVFSQNVRFRLAQALADLAETGEGDGTAHAALHTEALAALARPVSEPSLQGYARLLRGTLLARLGKFDEAATEVDASAAAAPAPPEIELVEARLAVSVGKGDFAGALKAVDAAKLDPGEKAWRRARVRLAECAARAKEPEREAAETALFNELSAVRAAARPEARATLAAVASAIREPLTGQAPEAWDLLADGAAALGDTARAGALARRAADRAEARGQKAQAVAYRLRAGAFLYQAEAFAEADPVLSKVVDDPAAGSARPRAGLLRALGRGRALALNRPGATQADYAAALEYQIKTFKDDPSASEARWLLGKLRLARGDRDGALPLWEAIPHGSSRWPESRAEIASLRQRELDLLRVNNDRDAVARRLADSRSFLARSLAQAQGEIERNEILLASARLELTPNVGRPEEARRACEEVEHSVARPDQRDAARRLQLVALAAMNRWSEAEQAARQEAGLSTADALLPTVRLIDRWAADSESDLRTRRMGYLLRILLTAPTERPETVPPDVRSELRLRYARALLFNGDDAGARRALTSGFTPPDRADDDLLRDLAETFTRLEAYEMAVDVQRLRSKNAPTGSVPWFDARYGLALAYYRAGKSRDAMHLIDATAILHPELGGGELHEKFVRLRQRISPGD